MGNRQSRQSTASIAGSPSSVAGTGGSRTDEHGSRIPEAVTWTPLTVALRDKKCDVATAVTLLEQRDVDVNAKAAEGRTALHFAAESGDCTLVELLLRRNANVGARDTSGKTPLRCAVEADDAPICALLLDHGANVNDTTTDGISIFQAALKRQGSQNLVLRMVEAHNSLRLVTVAKDGTTTLHTAAALQDSSMWIDLLLKELHGFLVVPRMHTTTWLTVFDAGIYHQVSVEQCSGDLMTLSCDPLSLYRKQRESRHLNVGRRTHSHTGTRRSQTKKGGVEQDDDSCLSTLPEPLHASSPLRPPKKKKKARTKPTGKCIPDELVEFSALLGDEGGGFEQPESEAQATRKSQPKLTPEERSRRKLILVARAERERGKKELGQLPLGLEEGRQPSVAGAQLENGGECAHCIGRGDVSFLDALDGQGRTAVQVATETKVRAARSDWAPTEMLQHMRTHLMLRNELLV